ncbi:MAG: cytochrome P450 [Moorea sp. SIOASIH]|uniref:cytochrome P450 n=1 Tax=Moorena sp. SIOASIH TaxID=2607817 RepID=UPI0013BD27F1|nr:cytochrome P450 [Moorena sp. SIOASIH]NEO42103.1 cytochrome P450 [Moorena sp. SIOASIH]
MPETIVKKNQTNQVKEPPLVPGLPIFGNALELTSDSVRFFVRNYQGLGPVFRVQALNQKFIIFAGPEANHFMSQFGDDYLTPRQVWSRMIPEYGTDILISALDGSQHRNLRQVMNRGYSREAILPHLPLLVKTTEQMVNQWQIGQRIEVIDAMRQLVVEQLGLALANHGSADYLQDLRLFFCTNLNVTFKGWPQMAQRLPNYLKAKARVIELGQEIIANHRTHQPIDRERDFIDDLLDATDENGEPFTEEVLVAQAFSLFFAGMETSANICTFMLLALLRHPEILERVTAEVDAVWTEQALSASVLREMKSLHATAMETLRMYPITLAVPRTAKQAFEFAGYFVAEKERVLVATTVSHFLPQFFPDPYTFDIDRYREPRNEHDQAGAYAPFGLGAHICLGKGMAEIQIMTIIATLLTRVRLAIDPPTYKLKTIYNPNPCPKNFWVRLIERRH